MGRKGKLAGDKAAPSDEGVAALVALVAESPLNISMIDLDGRMVAASEATIASCGFARENLVGLRIQDVFGEVAAPLLQLLAAKEITPVTLPPVATPLPNGKVQWIQSTFSPWRKADGTIGGVMSFSHNMTGEQLAQAELARTKALLDAVIEGIPSMIVVQEYDTGNYVRVNRALEDFMGLRRDQVIGRPPSRFRDKDWAAKHRETVERAERTNLPQTQIDEVRAQTGQMRTVASRRQVIGAEGGEKHVLTLAEDITERKQAEEALQAALRAAEAANLAKSAFLATMSHEIRTPLNGVLGMAQVMARDDLPPAQRERLDVIRQSGESLLSILNDILDLSKVEAGKLELEEIDFDLPHTLADAAASFAAIAEAKGLSLVISTDAAAGASRGDPSRVRQVVANLISNAVKFTASGEVAVRARRDGDHVSITVSDTGPGMAPDVLDRLFDKFVQADNSTTRRFGGTGLGLSICRELVELMDGHISVASTLGEGSSFTVILPLRRVAGLADVADELDPSLAGGLQILAAEDNLVNQQVLKTIFDQLDQPITLVGDGAMAVAAFRSQPWDIILMDVQMPFIDGCEATRMIREIERANGRARTPVIALTANAMEHQRLAYIAAGMDTLVAKPLQITELLTAINQLLSFDRAETPAQARA
jgi:PAS domain S-box-containing protein